MINTLSQRPGVGAGNIGIAAHSLGNLVVWEAARYERHDRAMNGRLARVMFNIQPAIWREAFDLREPVEYVAPARPVVYGLDTSDLDLRRHSWVGWFRQGTQGGIEGEHSALGAFDRVRHGYSPRTGTGSNQEGDGVLLNTMRRNDYFLRKWNLVNSHKHYHRRLTGVQGARSNPEYRTTDQANTIINEHQLDQIPAMLRPGRRRVNYRSQDLNEPIGGVQGPFDDNVNAKDGDAWRPGEHSDAWAIARNPLSGDQRRVQWFPRVYVWYQDMFADNTGPNIRIGVE